MGLAAEPPRAAWTTKGLSDPSRKREGLNVFKTTPRPGPKTAHEHGSIKFDKRSLSYELQGRRGASESWENKSSGDDDHLFTLQLHERAQMGQVYLDIRSRRSQYRKSRAPQRELEHPIPTTVCLATPYLQKRAGCGGRLRQPLHILNYHHHVAPTLNHECVPLACRERAPAAGRKGEGGDRSQITTVPRDSGVVHLCRGPTREQYSQSRQRCTGTAAAALEKVNIEQDQGENAAVRAAEGKAHHA